MSPQTMEKPSRKSATIPDNEWIPAPLGLGGPVYQAYRILHIGFVAAPLVAGLDKFFNLLTEWTKYLTPLVPTLLNVKPESFMRAVGAIEIAAGLIVAFRPRVGGMIVAFWLWGIIVNLLLIPAYFDIALRDFGLSLGALALSRLAREFESPTP